MAAAISPHFYKKTMEKECSLNNASTYIPAEHEGK